jgi:hypothetical protein
MANTKSLKPFKKGYDPRRWVNGRGKKSADQKKGDEILRAVIWEELSREFDMATMKPTETAETVDALRLMVRTWIKKNPAAVAERIAGKVTERVDLTTKGESIAPKVTDGERVERMKQLAVLIAGEVNKDA